MAGVAHDTTGRSGPRGDRRVRPVGVLVAMLTTVVLVFFVIRLLTDVPHLVDGTVPDDDLAELYVAHPWLAYGHMLPGVAYLLGAPLQLSARFRAGHLRLHRRLGRVLLACALVSGVLAVVLGFVFAWGGGAETSATLVFGSWFVLCLSLALRAVRARRIADHRRWMVRAFAVGLGVATIRLWVGLFTGVEIGLLGMGDATMPLRATFGVAFWLGLSMHVVAGEWWLRRRPMTPAPAAGRST
ncbi:DUF2306 domain-containing protein [Arthrobacter sp. NEB 688]|uniref:DUF2306 domain-containing protein n=1 Tax=Arthrobacter sp. NEB 688 TaxID=904039 RepID=UPI001563A3CE|nr:DUF2306 domain-containing protein [Arthrobacter sp. NEB 688]QKE84206.1 DUF2306 domain-containing protein [Arthrobacter sp. NEB 688]